MSLKSSSPMWHLKPCQFFVLCIPLLRLHPFVPTWWDSDTFLEENFYDSRSGAVLFEQIVATPPQLLLMFAVIEVSRTALASVPQALRRSWAILGSTVVDSWRVWPLSVYLL